MIAGGVVIVDGNSILYPVVFNGIGLEIEGLTS
jgi:hypothetical protein